jgi:hypothetical protein
MARNEAPVEESHESYVMVGFSRRNGSPGAMFGSSLRVHESYVTLRVTSAVRIHEDGYDRYFGSLRGEILEVDLSAAQFAELLTTMNIGSGVPGTLRYLSNRKVPNPPEAKVEAVRVREGFARDMKKLVRDAKASVEAVKEKLSGKTVSQSDRKAVLGAMEDLVQRVESDAPWMLQMFEEATEKVVVAAKAEMDAFATHNIVAEGLRSFAERAAAGEAPALPEGTARATLGEHHHPETERDEG